ncbi:hypothetical protein PoB_003724700 [Plakobranchus ocellatus]|uniref:Uncharacterized protein n=1 Tax=Plakobranchus ocellatus TaxID=259542 RepID=A0AAV4AUV8_9GAST|nr:hypothetical protein PoB_003724700 [Plakobranchus ocellatus]
MSLEDKRLFLSSCLPLAVTFHSRKCGPKAPSIVMFSSVNNYDEYDDEDGVLEENKKRGRDGTATTGVIIGELPETPPVVLRPGDHV